MELIHVERVPTKGGSLRYTVQLAGDIKNRLYYTIGSGLEDNGLFGFAATPRASLIPEGRVGAIFR